MDRAAFTKREARTALEHACLIDRQAGPACIPDVLIEFGYDYASSRAETVFALCFIAAIGNNP